MPRFRLDGSGPLHPWCTALRALPLVLVVVLPVLQLWRHFQDLQVYPFADEWLYVTVGAGGTGFPWAWLWEQHGDHRIPLQKASQWLLLDASDLDFRSLVILNLCVAAATALLLLQTARNLRGRSSPWDAMVPLLLFNPMAGHVMWGFHLQFLSSVFFTCLFAWAILRPRLTDAHVYAGFSTIVLCSLCGLNGLVQGGLMLLLLWFACPLRRREVKFRVVFCSTALLLACLWSSWSRTGAQQPAPGATELFQFFEGLLGASLLPPHEGRGPALLVGMSTGTAMLAAAYPRRGTDVPRTSWIALLLNIAVLLQLAAVAWGRARYQGGWHPTLAMHYGVLAMLLPITAWLALAARGHSFVAQVLGIAFVLTFGTGWMQAEQWRIGYTREQAAAKAQAYLDIKNQNLAIATVIERNAVDYWSNDPTARAVMAQGLPILREAYRRKWPDPAAAGPDHQHDQ